MHIPQTSSKSHSHLDSNRLITAVGFSMSIDKAGKLIIFTLTLQTPPTCHGMCHLLFACAYHLIEIFRQRKKRNCREFKKQIFAALLVALNVINEIDFPNTLEPHPSQSDYYLCIVISNFLYAIVTCRNRLRSCCAPARPTADTYNAFVIAESQMEIIKWEFEKNENRR